MFVNQLLNVMALGHTVRLRKLCTNLRTQRIPIPTYFNEPLVTYSALRR